MFYDDLTGWGRLNAHEALKMIEDETKQIIHPDSLVATNIIARDTIALGYNKAFVGDGWGPISRAIPLTREAEYEVEPVLIENTYYFGDYITPATQIIDYWERPSASNSIVFHRDTIQLLTALPPAGTLATKYVFDYFNLTPFDSITSIDLVNNELKIQGYYYHFMGEYIDIDNTGTFTGVPQPLGTPVVVDPSKPAVDEWYPANPFESSEMAFSIYIEDSTLTSIYDYPCDSVYLSFVDSVEHTFNLASITEELNHAISVYPNPVTNSLSVLFSNFGNHHLILNNSVGELLYEWKLVGDKTTINMESFAKGVYFLTHSSEIESTTIKIVKR